MTKTQSLWDRLTVAYPALATTVAGESPLRNAVELYAAGSCATVITEQDRKLDAECQDDTRSMLDVTCFNCHVDTADDDLLV